jgi:hypothetical protein
MINALGMVYVTAVLLDVIIPACKAHTAPFMSGMIYVTGSRAACKSLTIATARDPI